MSLQQNMESAVERLKADNAKQLEDIAALGEINYDLNTTAVGLWLI